MFIAITLLVQVPVPLVIILPIILLIGGFFIGFVLQNRIGKSRVESSKMVASRILDEAKHESKTIRETAGKFLEDAKQEAKALKKDSLLEAKDEILKLRQEQDRENKERKSEIMQSEKRIIQREEQLDKKEAAIDRKLDDLDVQKEKLASKEQDLIQKGKDLDVELQKISKKLEEVASLSKDEAKKQLIQEIEEDAKKEAAILVRDIETAAKDEADKKAKDIVGLAVQRCATDHSGEITVSVVNLPNDEMKGRIIGREGRNIRALENATGIDLIIDDTPEAIILSGFDPVRREVARLSVEKLISDGRIHPARIEEVVEKTRKEIEQQIKEAGEAAAFDANVFGLHPELIKLLGRLKFRTSYGQNVLKHSIEVSLLAGIMAAELGADVKLAKRGGLLHDIGKAVDHQVEGTHITIGEELARKFRENKEVVHCIAAHHNDIPPKTLEAILVQAADGISGGRPGARRESLENYVKRLEKLESIANNFKGVEKSFAIQAGREIRIVVKPEQVNDEAALFMAKDIAKKIEAEMDYPGQIKVNVIRELRSVEYAK